MVKIKMVSWVAVDILIVIILQKPSPLVINYRSLERSMRAWIALRVEQ